MKQQKVEMEKWYEVCMHASKRGTAEANECIKKMKAGQNAPPEVKEKAVQNAKREALCCLQKCARHVPPHLLPGRTTRPVKGPKEPGIVIRTPGPDALGKQNFPNNVEILLHRKKNNSQNSVKILVERWQPCFFCKVDGLMAFVTRFRFLN